MHVRIFLIALFILIPQALLAHEEHVTIRITDRGFDPKEANIVAGQAVVFVNEDSKAHWPAGNNHPTHTIYPGSDIKKCGTSASLDIFDACRGLQEGETYEFVFAEEGEWLFHDHLVPSWGGVIRVYASESEADSASSSEEDSGWRSRVESFFKGVWGWLRGLFGANPPPEMPSVSEFRALSGAKQQEVIRTFSAYDSKEAWEYLKQVALERGEQVLNAHELSHFVGNAAYRQKGIRGMEICDPAFAFGCYHGVAEEFLSEEGVEKVPDAGRTCQELFPDATQFAQYSSCIHGLGHGILPAEGLELPEALSACDMLTLDVQTYCYDGVFMEFSFIATRDYLDAEDPWALCDPLESKYHIPCARYFPHLVQTLLGYSPEAAARICAEGGTSDLRKHCVRRIGFDLASKYQGEPEGIERECDAFYTEPSSKADCMTASAVETVFQEFPEWGRKSRNLCGMLSAPYREACQAEAEQTARNYGRVDD